MTQHSLDSFVKPLDILYNEVRRFGEPPLPTAYFTFLSSCVGGNCDGSAFFTRIPIYPYNPALVLNYTWDFGDGTTASGTTFDNLPFSIQHNFPATGHYSDTYIVTLQQSTVYGTSQVKRSVVIKNFSGDAQNSAVTIVPFFHTSNYDASFQSMALDTDPSVVQTITFNPPVHNVGWTIRRRNAPAFVVTYFDSLNVLLFTEPFSATPYAPQCQGQSIGFSAPLLPCAKMIITPSGGAILAFAELFYEVSVGDGTRHVCAST